MKIVTPDRNMFLLTDAVIDANIAEHQEEYLTLPSLVTPDGRVVSQWMPEPNDLIMLNNGVPVTLIVHTFNFPLQPLQMMVGGTDLR